VALNAELSVRLVCFISIARYRPCETGERLMANPSIKRIGGTLAGLVAAIIVVALVEWLGHIAYPTPPGLDLAKPADQVRLMELIPFGAKLAVVASWFLGALAGCWAALRISGWASAAWMVAAVMVALSVTTQMLPHPVWMIVAALALPVLAAWLVLRRFAGGAA
jgi:hypothetical protein